MLFGRAFPDEGRSSSNINQFADFPKSNSRICWQTFRKPKRQKGRQPRGLSTAAFPQQAGESATASGWRRMPAD
jgi:hypothetical protein